MPSAGYWAGCLAGAKQKGLLSLWDSQSKSPVFISLLSFQDANRFIGTLLSDYIWIFLRWCHQDLHVAFSRLMVKLKFPLPPRPLCVCSTLYTILRLTFLVLLVFAAIATLVCQRCWKVSRWLWKEESFTPSFTYLPTHHLLSVYFVLGIMLKIWNWVM